MIKGTNLVTGAKAGLFTKWYRHNWLFQGKNIPAPLSPQNICLTSFPILEINSRWSPKNSKFPKKKKGKEK